MTNNEWAIICTIKQEPNYQFIQSEGSMAGRMTSKGLLAPIGNAKYTVTKKGEREYENFI